MPKSKLFSESFWGEKINGFDVLCQNLKHSLANVKDLEAYLRECANCEDSYGKSLNKLVTQISKFSANGTFNPLWSPLKEINEKYALSHIQLMHQLHELIRDTQKYNDELSKKIKKIRENETQTQNVVQSFQEIQQTLHKSKEQYHTLCVELEKQKRFSDHMQLAQPSPSSSSSSPNNHLMTSSFRNTSLFKVEKKLSAALDSYKSTIERYNAVRAEFERKLTDSCNHLQLAEEMHLNQMLTFVERHASLISSLNSNKQQIFDEFQLKLAAQYSVPGLIAAFIEAKRTGSEKPEEARLDSELVRPRTARHQLENSENKADSAQLFSPPVTPFNPSLSQCKRNSIASPYDIDLSGELAPMKRSDSKGYNIFNVEFLSRSKTKRRTTDRPSFSHSTNEAQLVRAKFLRNKPNRNARSKLGAKVAFSISKRNSCSLEDSNNTDSSLNRTPATIEDSGNFSCCKFSESTPLPAKSKSCTSMTDSFENFDATKGKATQDSKCNVYNESSGESDETDSDSSMEPVSIRVKIKPVEECDRMGNSEHVLKEISRSLQLNSPSTSRHKASVYNYSYSKGGANQAWVIILI
jgi:hypothetical protein